MLEGAAKAAFSMLAGSVVLQRMASRYGMRRPDSFARRFVAGETLDEAIDVLRSLKSQGYHTTLDYLGEEVQSTDAATAATREYIEIMGRIDEAGLDRSLSIKLTQLGMNVDRATSVDNLRRILDAGVRLGFFVRLDMEGSRYTEQTLDAFHTLWNIGYRNGGIAIQAYLRRSAADVERANASGVSVRLVKGAYREPRDIAFQHKTEVDAAYRSLMRSLLAGGTIPAIATHDPIMIDEAIRYAFEIGLSEDAFEFEMLYGVRRDLQKDLLAAGHHIRVYVPFGRQWFPYFMRRLGERPANVEFVIKSLAKEKS
jgi:proline dehydrogenase